MRMLHRCGLLFVLLGPVAGALAQTDAAKIHEASDVYRALRFIGQLSGGKLGDMDRPWFTLSKARGFLDSHNANYHKEAWQAALDAIAKQDSLHIAEDRAANEKQILENLKTARADILENLPTVAAADVPNDDGSKLLVYWRQTPAAKIKIEREDVTREGGEWEDLAVIAGEDGPVTAYRYDDDHLLRAGHSYRYRITAIADDGAETLLGETDPVEAVGNWIHVPRLSLLFFVVVLCGSVVYFIMLARRGVTLRIRKIAGLEAVDEAVGRATEMGRPIFFIPGIQDMNDIQTVAGLTVLGRVARTAAERDATLEVPTSKSLVMTAARETVQSSFLDVGRPDGYDEKKIYYTTDEQFGYVAAVTGAMVREKPATCFYMGAFFAESLILAETANMTGSIQIAGTAMPAQLPFFVAACDYTLIGEEFFAASAYLSGEPQQLGSLKGQDIGKIFVVGLICVGTITAAVVSLTEYHYGLAGRFLDLITHSILES